MTADLRALLGDRYVSTLRAAVLADNPDAIASAQAVGGKLGQLMYLSAVDRLDRVLTAVLPALLAERDALAANHWRLAVDAQEYPELEIPIPAADLDDIERTDR